YALSNASITATHEVVFANGRQSFVAGAGTAALIAPGTLYGDRFTQVDVKFSKGFRVSTARLQAFLDVYNLFNTSAILTQNNTFGAAWQTPTLILQGRLFKIGAQFDF